MALSPNLFSVQSVFRVQNVLQSWRLWLTLRPVCWSQMVAGLQTHEEEFDFAEELLDDSVAPSALDELECEFLRHDGVAWLLFLLACGGGVRSIVSRGVVRWVFGV